jgi:hypothetical protein
MFGSQPSTLYCFKLLFWPTPSIQTFEGVIVLTFEQGHLTMLAAGTFEFIPQLPWWIVRDEHPARSLYFPCADLSNSGN